MAKKKELITYDIKCGFNDFCMRELKLDITDDDKVYYMDTNEILKYNDKFLKYPESEYTNIRPDEIEFNLLKNTRIMESLLSRFLDDYQRRNNIEITSILQSPNPGGDGYCAFTYLCNGKTLEYISDNFKNESLRMFNLITKLNNTSHLYDFSIFDIVEE